MHMHQYSYVCGLAWLHVLLQVYKVDLAGGLGVGEGGKVIHIVVLFHFLLHVYWTVSLFYAC